MLFQVRGVGGAVGAQEEFAAAAGGHLHQRLAVLFALEHGQAVVVRANATGKDGVAVEQQVLRRDGGTDKAVGLAHVVGGFFGGDVFEDDFQLGEVAAQRDELLVDKGGLAVEQVDVAAGDFAVDEQQQALALHGFQHRINFAQIGHAKVAVGGGTGRVELAGDDASGFGAGDFFGGEVVGQVQRHQRLKRHACGHGGQDACFVGQCLRGGGHRRFEVGHDDGAGKLRCRVRHDGVHGSAIAHVQVPVVGAGEGQGGGGHGRGGSGRRSAGCRWRCGGCGRGLLFKGAVSACISMNLLSYS